MAYVYRPELHYRTFLNKLAGKTEINMSREEALDIVAGETDVCMSRISSALLKKKLHHLYGDRFELYKLITGRPVVTMTDEQIDTYVRLYEGIGELRAKFSTESMRHNMPSNIEMFEFSAKLIGHATSVIW
jgi:hypothetical protein